MNLFKCPPLTKLMSGLLVVEHLVEMAFVKSGVVFK